MKLWITALIFLLLGVAYAFADYPDRPVRLIVPTAVGGSADQISRLYADHLSKELGVAVVVQNMPGADGHVALTYFETLPPDGYNFLIWNSAQLPKIQPDTILQPIRMIAVSPLYFVASKKSGIVDYKKMYTAVTKRQNNINVGLSGNLMYQAITKKFIRAMEGEVNYIPYGTNVGTYQSNLIAGIIDLALSSSSSAVMKSENVLLSFSDVRLKDTVPTAKELGYNIVAFNWSALAINSKLPEHIKERIKAVPPLSSSILEKAMFRQMDLRDQKLVDFIKKDQTTLREELEKETK